MSITLFNYEWEFLMQLVNRIHCCNSYDELYQTFFKQLPTAISFKTGIFFKIDRENGHGVIRDYKSTRNIDLSPLMNGNYPSWSEFIMSPDSTVFRQSDLIPADKWERTHVYREIWAPINGYWGLMMSVVYNDHPLVLIGVYREKSEGDFTDRDVYIMNLLKPALEIKLYSLLSDQPNFSTPGFASKINRTAAQYKLTRRETEIARLICCHQANSEICDTLFIAPTTLNKHISNIYKKTNSVNRIQLIDLFSC